MLKNCPSVIPVQVDIFNTCWTSWSVSQAWKYGVLRLIFKSAARDNSGRLEKLRPIALTSCIGKIFKSSTGGYCTRDPMAVWIQLPFCQGSLAVLSNPSNSPLSFMRPIRSIAPSRCAGCTWRTSIAAFSMVSSVLPSRV